jgi:hypothetical protein
LTRSYGDSYGEGQMRLLAFCTVLSRLVPRCGRGSIVPRVASKICPDRRRGVASVQTAPKPHKYCLCGWGWSWDKRPPNLGSVSRECAEPGQKMSEGASDQPLGGRRAFSLFATLWPGSCPVANKFCSSSTLTFSAAGDLLSRLRAQFWSL